MSPIEDAHYPGLPFGRAELSAVMRRTYDDIIEFVTSDAFGLVVEEMDALDFPDRLAFIEQVLLDNEALAERGVSVPKDLLIQRSSFGDRRPTLFVVKKYLPEPYSSAWQNVNITFDRAFADDEVSRDPTICWRAPLPVAQQAQAMAAGVDLETL